MKTDNKLDIKGEKVLIIGNRSYRNMGDELILLGTIKLLLKQKKQITVSCFDPEWLKGFYRQFIDVDQITFIKEIPKGFRSFLKYRRKKGFKEFHYFAEADCIILGGGEILTEENPRAYSYWILGMFPFFIRKWRETRFKRISQRELIIMGGIQIPKRKKNKRLLRLLLKQSNHNYLRDFQAVEEVKEFGFPQTSFFMDTSYFAYPRDKVHSLENTTTTLEIKKNSIKKIDSSFLKIIERKEVYSTLSTSTQPYIVINLNRNGEKFLTQIAQEIQEYYRKGYQIFYVPVGKGKRKSYNDLQYINKLRTVLEKGVVIHLLDRERDFETFALVLKGAERVISTRLHLFLIASFMGVRTKVYPYQRKILKMQEVIKEVMK
ncbi:MAG: polysaccharide pyruvyl transferase family protein [Candidatus Absconditabacteria bacterium]|nr:polysaccharide pyruvyl transferase family protein [Candidatus Absconditabacteria bacterium]MDD3868600.1 polysaccharide pyruvyl transferase family protein [Candidatus Absconditabacteria bacterium]MDD4714731.1 polysaccharide pyruvyl transferase family protein [Candidatus Absconditabacteria bacterium]